MLQYELVTYIRIVSFTFLSFVQNEKFAFIITLDVSNAHEITLITHALNARLITLNTSLQNTGKVFKSVVHTVYKMMTIRLQVILRSVKLATHVQSDRVDKEQNGLYMLQMVVLSLKY